MAKIDWYRRTTWTEADKVDFYLRLKRSHDKTQYLRIQASTLASAGNYAVAIELLNELLEFYPKISELASAYSQLAEAYAHFGQLNNVIKFYEASLKVQQEYPIVKNSAWLCYPLFLVENEIIEHYPRANSILIENYSESYLDFPLHKYWYNSAKAVLLQYSGDIEVAKKFASAAIDAAELKHSGLRYHPNLGLVDIAKSKIHPRLIQLISDESTT